MAQDWADLLKKVKALAAKSAIDTAVGTLLEKNSRSLDHIGAMRKTMEDIAEIQFGKGTRPYNFMMHFLNGKGKDVTIDLSELFADDSSVKARVTGEVYRRVNEVLTVKESENLGRMSSIYKNGIDPIITIKQSNYSNEGWRNSLGTYDIMIEGVQTTRHRKEPISVILTSANIYRWHAEEKRITQTIHMIGQTLVNLNAAHDFAMRTGYTRILVDRSHGALMQMVTYRQTDPKNEHSVFPLAAYGRAILNFFDR